MQHLVNFTQIIQNDLELLKIMHILMHFLNHFYHLILRHYSKQEKIMGKITLQHESNESKK